MNPVRNGVIRIPILKENNVGSNTLSALRIIMGVSIAKNLVSREVFY